MIWQSHSAGRCVERGGLECPWFINTVCCPWATCHTAYDAPAVAQGQARGHSACARQTWSICSSAVRSTLTRRGLLANLHCNSGAYCTSNSIRNDTRARRREAVPHCRQDYRIDDYGTAYILLRLRGCESGSDFNRLEREVRFSSRAPTVDLLLAQDSQEITKGPS
jgi:hypothetical protein